MSTATSSGAVARIDEGITDALRGLVRSLPRAVQKRADGWFSILTGLGTGVVSDKVDSMLPSFFRGLPFEVLTSLFHGDAIARKIVMLRPHDALRHGVRVSVPDEEGGIELATALQDNFDDLDVVGTFLRAATWENLYGGSVVYMALDDGGYAVDSQAQPVQWDRVRKVLWLRDVDRTRVRRSHALEDYDLDERSTRYGEPLRYVIDLHLDGQMVPIKIHRDRLIIFPGIMTTWREREWRDGWGISVLDPVYAVLQRNACAWQSAAGAVSNAQYVIYKLKGLAHMFAAAGGEERARARARAMELAKSMINAVLVDADDDYIRENPAFGELPEMLEMFMLDVAAAADMPATRLWGRSPAGMNATGESDLEIWNQSLQAEQEHKFRPRLQQLVTALMYSKEGPTQGRMIEGWRVTFPPLRVLSDAERAEIRHKTSAADSVDIAAGVLLPQEVAKSRFRPEGYSQETTIDLDLRERMLKLEMDAAEKNAENAVELAEQGPVDPNAPTPGEGGAPPEAGREAAE